MLILIGCEESQVVTKAFREAGHEAYSCDLQPTRGNAYWHFQQDIMEVMPTKKWDLIILHPDCTAMALSNLSNPYKIIITWNTEISFTLKTC